MKKEISAHYSGTLLNEEYQSKIKIGRNNLKNTRLTMVQNMESLEESSLQYQIKRVSNLFSESTIKRKLKVYNESNSEAEKYFRKYKQVISTYNKYIETIQKKIVSWWSYYHM